MITMCKMCTKVNNQCSYSETAKSWKDLVNKPECLDYEQNKQFSLERLSYHNKGPSPMK